MSSLQDRGGIFISYRREQTAAQAGRLYDRLSDRFGEDRVFMDVDSIAIGVDFIRAVTQAVSGCDILLALIGPDWSALTDSSGTRRLDDPGDLVRVEIEAALQRDVPVVPVLVDGAVLPRADDLPPSLRPLIRRQAFGLSHAGFRSEVTRLLAAVGQVLEAEQGRSAMNYIDEGNHLRKQGLFQAAETAYRTALDLAPASAPAHLGLGNALYGLERYREAEAAFREAIHLDPTVALYHNNLGNALYRLERYAEAEAAYREAIRLDPTVARTHNYLGNTLNGLERYREAEAAFREAIHLDPTFAIAHCNLGNALHELERYREAEAAYREAIRLDPTVALYHRNLAVVLGALGRKREAKAANREAARFNG